jgi:UPF0148 protein
MGATLLGEPCPKCGGVQVRYKGRVYCTQHEDLSTVTTVEPLSVESVSESARKVILAKINDAVTSLSSEKDVERQEQLVSMISKCFDTLQKLSASRERA